MPRIPCEFSIFPDSGFGRPSALLWGITGTGRKPRYLAQNSQDEAPEGGFDAYQDYQVER